MYLQKWNKSEINDFRKVRGYKLIFFENLTLCRNHHIKYWGAEVFNWGIKK